MVKEQTEIPESPSASFDDPGTPPEWPGSMPVAVTGGALCAELHPGAGGDPEVSLATNPTGEAAPDVPRGEHEVVVEIDAPAHVARQYLRATMGRVEEVDEHSCRLRGSTNEPREYVWGLGRMPFAFRVHGEPFERAAREIAEQFAAAAP